MRRALLPMFLLAACSSGEKGETLAAGTYAGAGRDALCIMGEDAPQRFAFIAFAPEGDTNCAAEGRVERSADGWLLVPLGEGPCRLPLIADGQTLRFGDVPDSCAYYCGPKAAWTGQAFRLNGGGGESARPNPLGHRGAC